MQHALTNKSVLSSAKQQHEITTFKPGFHIIVSVVSVVSVVRKKFIGQLQLYGNLSYKCSIQKKRQIQLFVRDRMNSLCPMNFFRTTDTTDTTIWKPGFTYMTTAWVNNMNPIFFVHFDGAPALQSNCSVLRQHGKMGLSLKIATVAQL